MRLNGVEIDYESLMLSVVEAFYLHDNKVILRLRSG